MSGLRDKITKAHFKRGISPSIGLIEEIIDLVENSQLELLVLWSSKMGFSTGHASTIESLLDEIELDIKELLEKARLSD